VSLRAVSFITTSGSTTYTVSRPAGAAAGDVLLAGLSFNASGSVVAPAGWTLVAHTRSASVVDLWTYYHVVDASEPASYSWKVASSGTGVIGIADYAGVDTSAPIAGFSSAKNGSGSATVILPQVATTGRSVAVLLLTTDGTAHTTPTFASTFTRRWALVNYERGYEADNLTVVDGAQPSQTIKLSAANVWSAQLIALRIR